VDGFVNYLEQKVLIFAGQVMAVWTTISHEVVKFSRYLLYSDLFFYR